MVVVPINGACPDLHARIVEARIGRAGHIKHVMVRYQEQLLPPHKDVLVVEGIGPDRLILDVL